MLLLFVPWACLQEYFWVGLCDHMLPYFIMQSLQGMWFRTCSNIACSRLSVSEDDRESERVTSGISCERDLGVKRRGHPLFLNHTPLVARSHFLSPTPTERLEQASCNSKAYLPRPDKRGLWLRQLATLPQVNWSIHFDWVEWIQSKHSIQVDVDF